MAEFQDNPRTRITELEKTFQEYKTRLEHAEEEAEQIINSAWQKAESIIADAQGKSQQVADDVRQKARLEADRIVQEAKSTAERLVKETDERCRKEAKEKARREVEKILVDTRKEAEDQAFEVIARSKREAEQIVSEVKESARAEGVKESAAIISRARDAAAKISEDTIARSGEVDKLLAEVMQKTEGVFDLFRKQAQKELADLSMSISKAKDSMEIGNVMDRVNITDGQDAGKAGEGKPFSGKRELNIVPPYDGTQIRRLVESLKQIPSLRLTGEAGTEDDYSIYVDMVEPFPLMTILREMSFIASSDIRGNTIKLRLKPGRNGN